MKIINRIEAKALGLKHYFIGKTCRHGHAAIRYVSNGICVECATKRSTAWRKANPQSHCKKVRAWQKANESKLALRRPKYDRAYRETHREEILVHKRNRRARQRGNGGSHTAADIKDLYRLQGGRCACGCNEPLKKKYHVDHILPLKLGGNNDRSNLQLLRPKCNLRKLDRDPIIWAQENGRLL